MYIILIVVILLVLFLVGAYNSLVSGRNRVDEAWSDIDVQLKRRYDLIPNLVESVKGYMKQESSVLQNVTNARATAMSAGPSASLDQKLQQENQLSSTLKSLFAVAESYPDLKSSQNFLSLQGDLTDTEDKIQAARRFYNGNVRDYNTKLQTFPTNIFASMFGFVKKEFFGIDASGLEAQPVKVQF